MDSADVLGPILRPASARGPCGRDWHFETPSSRTLRFPSGECRSLARAICLLVRAASPPTRWAAISARTGSKLTPTSPSPSTRRSSASTFASYGPPWPSTASAWRRAASRASSSGWHLAETSTSHAAGQDRPEVKAARETRLAGQLDLDLDRLVFIDETSANTAMLRRNGPARGRSLSHERAPGSLENHDRHGRPAHERHHRFLAARCRDEMVGLPNLRGRRPRPDPPPGDMVNLSAHKVSGIHEQIEAVGAQLLYLPAYSPDSTPSSWPSRS